MKKSIFIFLAFALLIIVASGFFLKGMIISNTTKEDCEVMNFYVTNIEASDSKDIFFTSGQGKSYYINRGTERGLSAERLLSKVLHKHVEVYLANIITGTSNHICQLSLGEQVLFTEFEK